MSGILFNCNFVTSLGRSKARLLGIDPARDPTRNLPCLALTNPSNWTSLITNRLLPRSSSAPSSSARPGPAAGRWPGFFQLGSTVETILQSVFALIALYVIFVFPAAGPIASNPSSSKAEARAMTAAPVPYPPATCAVMAAPRPDPKWPGGAKVCVQFRAQLRRGRREQYPAWAIPIRRPFSPTSWAPPIGPGQRHWNMESIYEYGARGRFFWRLWAPVSPAADVPVTVYGVATALASVRPTRSRLCRRPGWEIASHGLKWIEYKDISDSRTERGPPDGGDCLASRGDRRTAVRLLSRAVPR